MTAPAIAYDGSERRDSSWLRIRAIARRHWFVMIRSPHRLFDVLLDLAVGRHPSPGELEDLARAHGRACGRLLRATRHLAEQCFQAAAHDRFFLAHGGG